MSSLQLTTPLILSGDPTHPRHASTKQYVDMVLGHPNAMGFTSGTIPVAKLPALTGVVSSDAGDNVLTLNNSGVTPGTYTKVMVSSGGRITAGTSISEDEIQSVDWSRITSGKPTTLAGYGITDVLPSTGGTITGSLKLTQPPSDNLHPVTKAYVDNALLTGDTSLDAGDIIRKPTSVTPSGFLRLNGGVLSKTTYAALYAKVGDTFGVPGWFGAGRPWEQLNYINKTSPESISGWTNGTNLPEAIEKGTALVTKNRVYLMGGITNPSAASPKIYTAVIDTNGVIGGWIDITTIIPNGGRYDHGLFVTKNRVYLVGGYKDSSTRLQSTVFFPISSDGLLGSYQYGTVLPESMAAHSTFVTKNRVYLVGSAYGDIDRPYSVVLTASIDNDGAVGNWSRVSDLPVPMSNARVIVTKSKVYFVYNTNLYSVPINSDGTIGVLTQEATLPFQLLEGGVLATNTRVYIFGPNVSHTAPIDSDGNIGSWSQLPDLSLSLYRSTVLVTSSRVYLLGGRFNGGSIYKTLYAPLAVGLNDYSPYYNTLTSSDYFSIPDYSGRETNRLCYYIKT